MRLPAALSRAIRTSSSSPGGNSFVRKPRQIPCWNERRKQNKGLRFYRDPKLLNTRYATWRSRMSIDDAARLLIADDDPDLLAAYVLYFSAHGFDIRTARNGLDALAQYCAWHPGAALLDV